MGFVVIEEGNEADLEMAVATIGPVAVVVDGDHASFMQYESGVYYEKRCSNIFLNHAVRFYFKETFFCLFLRS